MKPESAFGTHLLRVIPDLGTHKRVIAGVGSGLRLSEPQQEADGKKRKLGLSRWEAAHLPGCGPGPQVVRSAVQCPVPTEIEEIQLHSA